MSLTSIFRLAPVRVAVTGPSLLGAKVEYRNPGISLRVLDADDEKGSYVGGFPAVTLSSVRDRFAVSMLSASAPVGEKQHSELAPIYASASAQVVDQPNVHDGLVTHVRVISASARIAPPIHSTVSIEVEYA